MHYRITLLTFGLFLSSACNGGGGNTTGGETDTSTDSASGTDGVSTGTVADPDPTTTTVGATDTDSASTTPTTDDHETGTSEAFTTDATVGGDTTTLGPGTTTEPSETTGDVPGSCAGLCDKFIECQIMADLDTCLAECSENFDDVDRVCLAATGEFFDCVATLTCEQIEALDEGEPGPCEAQLAAQTEACGSDACIASVGSNRDGTECGVSEECPDEPAREMNCDIEVCTCLEGGKNVGQCDSDGVCQDISGLEAKSAECCGF
jgi:hypothetical protein